MHVKVRGQFAAAGSPSTLWVQVVELRSVGLAASTIYNPLNHLFRPEPLNTDVLCFGIMFMWFFSFAHIKMLFIKWLQKEALVCRSYFVFSGNNAQ